MPGPAPYGWRRERGQLVPIPAEQAVRFLVLHLKRQGWTLQAISDELTRLHLFRNGQRFSLATLHRIHHRGDAGLQDTG